MRSRVSIDAHDEGPRVARSVLGVLTAAAAAPALPALPAWVGVGFFILLLLVRPPRARAARVALLLAVCGGVIAVFGSPWAPHAGLALLVLLSALKSHELASGRDDALAATLVALLLVCDVLVWPTLPAVLYAFAGAIAVFVVLARLAGGGVRAARAHALVLALLALPLALAFHAAVPPLSRALDGQARGDAGHTGLPDTLNPGAIAELGASDAVAFRAYFHRPPPARAQRYWRALVLTQTDGRRWFGEGAPRPGSARGFGAPLRYRVASADADPRLPVLGLPLRAPAIALAYGDVARATTDARNHTISSYLDYRTAAPGARERARMLALPPGANPRTVALAQSWRHKGLRGPALVQAALTLFHRDGYRYTLHPPILGADAVDQFLFSSRRGFCEHFAAAFATLMRAGGVPARVVVGYQGGETNPFGDFVTVRARDAHAWVEVALPGAGWVRVDPTAVVPGAQVDGGGLVRALRAAGAPGRYAAALLTRAQALWDAAAHGPVSLRIHIIVSAVALLLAMAAALALARARLPAAPDAVFARVCARLARTGLARAPVETPRAYLERCLRARPQWRPWLLPFTEDYLTLRYAPAAPRAASARLRRHARRLLFAAGVLALATRVLHWQRR